MRSPKTAAGILLCLWIVIRLLLIPADPALTNEFSHDSGYISIVARNLMDGRGYVNDAHWLLFLNPSQLPMPYHNANPLYPTLAAAVSWVAGVETPKAAAMVSAASNVLLAVSVFWLVRRFTANFPFCLLAAAAAALWPSNFRESFSILPDALSTSLLALSLAALVHARRWWHWGLFGAAFGLAWLTRSSALLILPGVLIWTWRQERKQWPGLAAALAVALIVTSPWLVHTARVRGSPFASDDSYYWLQEYHAYKSQRTVGQYWRSLQPPPSTGHLLMTEGADLAAFIVTRLPRFADRFVRTLYDRNWVAGIALIPLLAFGLVLFPWRSLWSTPAFLAAAVVVVASTAALVPRPDTVEIRYWSVANLLLLLAFLAPFGSAPNKRSPALVGLALSIGLFSAILDAKTLVVMLRTDPERVAYRQRAEAVKPHLDGGPVIVDAPYYFTYFTGVSAINPPYPSKNELLAVMAKYGARFVFLPRGSLQALYPGAPEALAPELQLEGEVSGATLLRRR